MNVGPRPWELKDLKDTTTIVRIMDTKYMNADLRPSGHQSNKQRYTKMETPMIGITTKGIVITIVKNMDMFLRIILRHTSEVTTRDG